MNSKSENDEKNQEIPDEVESGPGGAPEESGQEAKETAGEPSQDDLINGLTCERDRYHDNWLRVAAELENYKKRVLKEREEFRRFALEGIIKDLLSPIDYLEMAVAHARETTNIEALIQGVQYTHKCLMDILKGYGVEPVDSGNGEFDPSLHEAHEVQETDEVKEGTILKEHRKAYKISGRLLRAGIVTVSKKPDKPEESEKSEQTDESKEE